MSGRYDTGLLRHKTKDGILVTRCACEDARFIAQDLFSSFLWALAECPEVTPLDTRLEASICPRHVDRQETGYADAWRDFGLENQELQHLAQKLTLAGLFPSQDEAFLSLIPPLSATGQLPWLDRIVAMARENGAELERQQAWERAGAAYSWLLRLGLTFPRTSVLYAKSAAMYSRFAARIIEYRRTSTAGDERCGTSLVSAIDRWCFTSVALDPEDVRLVEGFHHMCADVKGRLESMLEVDDEVTASTPSPEREPTKQEQGDDRGWSWQSSAHNAEAWSARPWHRDRQR